MAFKRNVIFKTEETFDNYQQAVEYCEDLSKRYTSYDLTIEATARGVWVIFEAYEWEVSNDR